MSNFSIDHEPERKERDTNRTSNLIDYKLINSAKIEEDKYPSDENLEEKDINFFKSRSQQPKITSKFNTPDQPRALDLDYDEDESSIPEFKIKINEPVVFDAQEQSKSKLISSDEKQININTNVNIEISELE